MPRRYRPPTRRRKSKERPGEAVPPSPYAAEPAAPAPRPAAPAGAEHRDGHAVRHISRDHTYVLDEMKRIAFLVTFIVGGLVITAILR
jgi:hypothetical protein